MSDSHEITITPPLTMDEIKDGPELRTIELVHVRADGETFPVEPWTANALEFAGGSMVSCHPNFIAAEIQKVVDYYVGHAFTGFIEVRNASPGQPSVSRYHVRDGRVVREDAVLAWPGDGGPAGRFTVTWDHDFVNLWCLDCCDADPDCDEADSFAGNPTGMDEILVAMQAHRTEQHGEVS